MSLEENKKWVADFFNAMKIADLETLDKITTDDFAFKPMIGEGGLKKEAMLKMIGGVLDAFSEHTNRIDDIVVEGDKVSVRMIKAGKKNYNKRGVPNNRHIPRAARMQRTIPAITAPTHPSRVRQVTI